MVAVGPRFGKTCRSWTWTRTAARAVVSCCPRPSRRPWRPCLTRTAVRRDAAPSFAAGTFGRVQLQVVTPGRRFLAGLAGPDASGSRVVRLAGSARERRSIHQSNVRPGPRSCGWLVGSWSSSIGRLAADGARIVRVGADSGRSAAIGAQNRAAAEPPYVAERRFDQTPSQSHKKGPSCVVPVRTIQTTVGGAKTPVLRDFPEVIFRHFRPFSAVRRWWAKWLKMGGAPHIWGCCCSRATIRKRPDRRCIQVACGLSTGCIQVVDSADTRCIPVACRRSTAGIQVLGASNIF